MIHRLLPPLLARVGVPLRRARIAQDRRSPAGRGVRHQHALRRARAGRVLRALVRSACPESAPARFDSIDSRAWNQTAPRFVPVAAALALAPFSWPVRPVVALLVLPLAASVPSALRGRAFAASDRAALAAVAMRYRGSAERSARKSATSRAVSALAGRACLQWHRCAAPANA